MKNPQDFTYNDNHLTDLNGVFLNENSNHFDELNYNILYELN